MGGLDHHRLRRSGTAGSQVAGKLEEARKALAEGLSLSPEKQTVAQFLDRWLEDVIKPNASPKTHRTYADLSRLHIKPASGGVDLRQLSPQQVQHRINILAAAGLSPVGGSPSELLIHYFSHRRTVSNGASDLFLMFSRCLILEARGAYEKWS